MNTKLLSKCQNPENNYPKITVSKFTSKRRCGLELEFGNKISGQQICNAIKKVDKERDIQVSEQYSQDTNNEYWHVKFDHSCGDIRGEYGWEVASFTASGIKDILLLSKATDSIREFGANVNNRCALHNHVEVADFSQAQISIMLAIWIKIEPYICHVVPSYRADGDYCKFFRHENWVSDLIYDKTRITPELIWSYVKPTRNDNRNRRKSINICNYYFTDRKTVEFRFPESTLSGYEVRNWMRFFITFVEMCKTAEIPKNLDVYTFPEFLEVCGFYRRNPFLILSSGMRETKIWLLRRAIKFSRSAPMIARAKEHLLNVCKTEELEEKCGS